MIRVVLPAHLRTLAHVEGEQIQLLLHWQGGDHTRLTVKKNASSEESVGDVRFRQSAKCMIQCDFRDVEGSEAVGFSHGQFSLVVEALDHTAG